LTIRDKMRESAEPYLGPDERIQAVFGAQTISQYWAPITLMVLLFTNAYRVVVVTDRRILVCRAGRLVSTSVKEVLRELPRATRIGPATGFWYRSETLGERLYTHKRFYQDVVRADDMMTA
jgi:hypothetical protein